MQQDGACGVRGQLKEVSFSPHHVSPKDPT